MYALKNEIRPYPWGSTTAIPRMLGVPPTGEPQAEMWIGAHPASPSVVLDGTGRPLTEVIAADPERELGDVITERFGNRLPFLLKLLAADEPLSLQAHPDPALAVEGFERENAAGIPIDSSTRNYKDPYAKPEMICALTDLEALVGFRSLSAVWADVEALGVAEELRPYLSGADGDDDIRRVFRGLLELGADERARLVAAVLARTADSTQPIARLLHHLGTRYPTDSGVLAALLMNHLRLTPGSAVLLPSGNLHAYVSGVGVELLANSDNVLRGGLTGKHIDIPELLGVVDFSAAEPAVIPPETESPEQVFPTPAEEFRLSRIVTNSERSVRLEPFGGQLLLCTEGEVRVHATDPTVADRPLRLTPGHSAWVAAADGAVALGGEGVLFRAHVG